MLPIIRGKCDACGYSRNIWLSEMASWAIPCNHADRGCSGNFQVVYRGPKSGIPAMCVEPCTCGTLPAIRGPDLSNAVVATILPSAAAAPTPACLLQERVPDFLDCSSELSGLSDSRLAYMEANSIALDDWIVELPQVKACFDRATELRGQNLAIANQLLDKQQAIDRALAAKASAETSAAGRQESVRELLHHRDKIVQSNTPAHLGALLAASAQQAESVAHKCLQDAYTISGPMDSGAISSFRQRYVEHNVAKHTKLALKQRLSSS